MNQVCARYEMGGERQLAGLAAAEHYMFDITPTQNAFHTMCNSFHLISCPKDLKDLDYLFVVG